jgi:hypothetical protein
VPNLTTAQHEQQQRLICETLGHAWDVVDSNHWTASFGTPLTARCMRCGEERRDQIGANGQVIPGGRRYIMPEWYRRYGKGERPTRADFRLMLIQQRIREARAARKRTAS